MAASDIDAASAGVGRSHRGVWWRRKEGVPSPPALLWVPALLVAAAMALPLAYLVVRAAGAGSEAWELLLRGRTAAVLWRSLVLVDVVTVSCVAIALPLAWLTTRTDLPFRGAWGVLTSLPLVIPSYVGAFLVVSALGPKGLLQGLLSELFEVERLPDIYGFGGAALTLSLLSYPYILLAVRGSLANLDPVLEESARSLGAGFWGRLFRVTLPQLAPAIGGGMLLVGLYTLSDFGAVSLLGYETFTWAIFQQYGALDRGGAAVLSLLLVAVAVVLLVRDARGWGRTRYHRSGAGAPRVPHVVRLGRWRWPGLAFCAVIVLAALVLPIGVLAYWLVRGVQSGEPLLVLWGTVRNSVYVSGMAALAAAVCSIPVAALVVRYPGVLSRVLERLSFVGYALPGIVVALALVFFGSSFIRPVYQTVWLLLLAYLVLFLPAALVATRASFLQVSPRLEEAARGLGRTPVQTMRSVTVPLILSGVLAGAAMVFLITMKELPATLILGPPGFKTLATSIWSASSEAFFARAAAPALLLILMSSVPMAFLVLREGRARR